MPAIGSLHRQTPQYLSNHITTVSDVTSRLRVRSANQQQLLVRRCRLDMSGFHHCWSLTVWNSLPEELRDPTRGSDSFKQFPQDNLVQFLLMSPAH